MFNRENIKVRPLSEELEGIGLDPDKVMDDIERNAGLLEQEAGSPPSSEAVRPHLTEEAGDADDDGEEFVEWDGGDLADDEELVFLGEKIVKKKVGYREDPKTGKMKKVTIQTKRKEKSARRLKKGAIHTAQRMYAKRFKTKIKKRRMKRKRKGSAGKGRRWANENIGISAQLQQLREDLENSDVNTGEVTPFEEAALNAGWLALLLGECFETMGDAEAGTMLYAMSDSAADLSEEIEAANGDISEELEAKMTSLLEGVTKALATHEEIGSPSLFESIEIGRENGLYEDEDEDEEDDLTEDDESGDDGAEDIDIEDDDGAEDIDIEDDDGDDIDFEDDE